MGLFDRAKSWLGLGASDDAEPEEAAKPAGDAKGRDPRAALRSKKDGRPPLKDVEPAPSATVEDALAAREAGDKAEARKVLAEIDRGAGLRTVLRAAAALEASDERELADLLPIVAREEPRWRLSLQIAAALAASGDESAAAWNERAASDG